MGDGDVGEQRLSVCHVCVARVHRQLEFPLQPLAHNFEMQLPHPADHQLVRLLVRLPAQAWILTRHHVQHLFQAIAVCARLGLNLQRVHRLGRRNPLERRAGVGIRLVRRGERIPRARTFEAHDGAHFARSASRNLGERVRFGMHDMQRPLFDILPIGGVDEDLRLLLKHAGIDANEAHGSSLLVVNHFEDQSHQPAMGVRGERDLPFLRAKQRRHLMSPSEAGIIVRQTLEDLVGEPLTGLGDILRTRQKR
eukprot:scaffold263_cov251-Pinguiococcus_pyrenoidosus.AAC.9